MPTVDLTVLTTWNQPVHFETHPQLHNATVFVKKQLNTPDNKEIELKADTIHRTMQYCRSVYRSLQREQERRTYFCSYCDQGYKTYITSRPAHTYAINHGFRLHCCGTPTCYNCFNYVRRLAFCDFCHSYFTGTSELDQEVDTAFVTGSGSLCCLTMPGLRKDIRRQIRQLYSHQVTYYVHYNYTLSSHLLSHCHIYF